MDNNGSARFLAYTTAISPALQSSGDSPGQQHRRHSSGSESGLSSDGSVADYAQRLEHPQPAFEPQRDQLEAENSTFYSQRRPLHDSATIYVDDAPYIPPTPFQTSQNQQYSQTGSNSQYQYAYSDYHARMPPPAAQRFQQVPLGHNSGGSSPAESVRSAGSDQSGHLSNTTQSVSSRVSDPGNQYVAQSMSMEGQFNVQSATTTRLPFNPERYPAYDVHARRIGMEHILHDSTPHDASGQSYYRTRTLTYPSANEGPHILSMTLDSANTQDFPRPGPSPLLLAPSTPLLDYSTRAMSLDDAQLGSLSPNQTPPQQVMGHSLVPARRVEVPNLPDPTPNLRQLLGLGPDEEVSLYSLADPSPGEKPNYSYPTLIKLAIHGSPKKRLTLQEIYAALEDRFDWFRDNAHDKAWQNSIRHNLSLNKCFRRVNKPITEPGKGSYWVVDYSQGEGNKRERKRNKRPTKAELARRAKEAQAAASNQGSHQEDSSSSDEDQTGTGQSQGGTPVASQASSATPDDSNIDPELRNHGHVVGEGRVRATASSARSNARRANSPYAPAAGTSQAGAAQGRATPANSTSHMGVPQLVPQQTAGPAPPAFGQPAFGQPAFGQTSLSSWPAPFGGSQAQPTWGAVQSQAGASSGQGFMGSAPVAPGTGVNAAAGRTTRSMTAASGQRHGLRYVPIRPATPREALMRIGGSSGLVTARRIDAGASVAQGPQGPRPGRGAAPGPGNRRGSGSSGSSLE